MFQTKILVGLLTICVLAASVACAEEAKKLGTERTRFTKVWRLKNVAAQDAADKINGLLPIRRVHSGNPNYEVVVVPDVTTNSIVLSANAESMAFFNELIALMDKSVPILMFKVEVRELDADGKERVISRPQLMTQDGLPAAMSVGGKLSGDIGNEEKIDFKLTKIPQTKEIARQRQGFQMEIEPQLMMDHKHARLKIRINRQIADESVKGEVTLRGETLLSRKTIELDKPFKIVVATKDNGEPQFWADIVAKLVTDEQK